MLSHSFLALFALAFTTVAGDFANSLTCHTSSDYLTAISSPTPHGSQVGSYISPSTRCPRAKPTTTITSTITSGQSVVPTGHGFTPISSETYSATSTPNKDINSIVVSFDDSDRVTTVGEPRPTSRSCGLVNTDSSTIWSTPSTCPSFSTVTASTTITTPSSISYDACGTDNLVSFVTDPARDSQRTIISSLIIYNVTAYTALADVGAPTCCAACQTLGCAYGWWTVSNFGSCQLYFQDDCDGKEWLGSTFGHDTPTSSNPDGNGFGFTVFNGPCGQIVPGGPSP
ncbi:MAG: hypothetical protein L6R38_007607 [Xanthoria sp. 2 TBL-2021]|nr:MAG: hypothetical protein L6R38_007607 [Xanthoria sp. 2 TBL-2021]